VEELRSLGVFEPEISEHRCRTVLLVGEGDVGGRLLGNFYSCVEKACEELFLEEEEVLSACVSSIYFRVFFVDSTNWSQASMLARVSRSSFKALGKLRVHLRLML
jgi:hypothetical protein